MDTTLDFPADATHYEILGVPVGTTDPAVLEEAALKQSARARACQLAKPRQATKLLRQIALALSTLSDAQRRAEYDASLEGPSLSASVLGSALLLLRGESDGDCSLWAISFRKVNLDAKQRKTVLDRIKPGARQARFARILRKKQKGRTGQLLLGVVG